MAFYQLSTGAKASLDEYNQVQERLAATGTAVPGRILQVCFGDKDDVKILNVWESQEACDSFMQSVMMPLFEEFGITDRGRYIETGEVHKVSLAGPAAPGGS